MADAIGLILSIIQLSISALPKFMELAQGRCKDYLSMRSNIFNTTWLITSQIQLTLTYWFIFSLNTYLLSIIFRTIYLLFLLQMIFPFALYKLLKNQKNILHSK